LYWKEPYAFGGSVNWDFDLYNNSFWDFVWLLRGLSDVTFEGHWTWGISTDR
jgi:hypothetical protein